MLISSTIAFTLPALAVAQQQKPLGATVQDWYSKAKSYVPSAASAPWSAGAAKAAEHNVVPITLQNWRETLTPNPMASTEAPEEWMMFVTGGNKTCYGQCGKVEKAWNESAAILSAKPSPPNLAYLDCEDQRILCNIFAAGAPSIWHILLPKPQADQSRPATTIRLLGLDPNSTSADIVKIHATKSWKEATVYEGVFHPFDGQFAKFGVNVPVGYALYAFSVVPSWAFMLVISFASRTLMSRRLPAGGNARPTQAHPGGAPPAG
ncbi:MAG: hypothetical protein M1812_005008 [Candelaria pacifica]|nr:MAG: hypothetical protein M1812_005008 [Candelaria pacifica]